MYIRYEIIFSNSKRKANKVQLLINSALGYITNKTGDVKKHLLHRISGIDIAIGSKMAIYARFNPYFL